jgi:hypothetical protein
MRMSVLRGVLGAVLVLLALPATGGAVVVGIGDQKPDMFTDSRFLGLGIRHARLNIGWDSVIEPAEREKLDAWMSAARKARVAPLVTFGHSWVPRKRRMLPTLDQFVEAFLQFRERYPWVRDFATWNEANHCGEPTCNKPALVADYYYALRTECPRCRILAAELLDLRNMTAWVRRFRARLGYEPGYWGLHNYLDANRLRLTATQQLLRSTRGKIWLTETGGIVARRNRSEIAPKFEESARHAAIAMRWLFDRLVPLSPRIKRVYVYQWNALTPHDTWDSALVGPTGKVRPAYHVFKRRLLAQRNRNGLAGRRRSKQAAGA